MKHIKHKNQFPKVGFKVLLWIGLLYSSLGQALAQVPETDAKHSETAETAELEQEKIELTKPVPGSLQDFDILHKRNIFDPNRKPYREPRKPQDPEPEPQIDAFTVIGLMAYADRQIVVLSGSSSEYNGVFKLNDQIDNLKLISLGDKAVSFAEGETNFSVGIGTGLRRVDGGDWKESTERVSSTSRSQYSSRGTTRSDENTDSAKESEDKAGEADDSEDSAAELLRKMMERRRQEVGE
ncbi:hypothetical protein OAH16_01685 [bacterium]|jgi:hypothetical protein|nr:hypothetical protein [bacterium]